MSFPQKNSKKKIRKKIKKIYFMYYHNSESEDRSCTIDNGCFEVVERCRYVTGGMKFDLTPLPSTTDVSFVHNTLSNELRQIKTTEISFARLAVVLCTSADGV